MLDLIADIAGQPDALLQNASLLERAYNETPDWVGNEGLVVTGMATSLWAWHSAGLVLQNERVRVTIADTSEYLRYGLAAQDTCPVMITSRSGESAEIIKLLDVMGERQVIALTASAQSSLSTRAGMVLHFEAEEAAFYNTKSFLLTMCMALASSAGIASRADLAPLAWVGRLATLVRRLTVLDQSIFEPAGQAIAAARVVLVTGRGHLIGVAQQAALDLQEGMQIAALPVPGGLLRHGPMELVQLGDSAVVMMVPADHMQETNLKAVCDLVDIGATVIVIATEGVEIPQGAVGLHVPASEPTLTPMLFAVALQRVTVSIAQALGMSSITPSLIPKITRVE